MVAFRLALMLRDRKPAMRYGATANVTFKAI